MHLRNTFIHLHPAAKLLILITLSLIGMLVMQIFHFFFLKFASVESIENSSMAVHINIGAMKILQFISSFIVWLIPAYIIAYISTPHPSEFLKTQKPKRYNDFPIAAIIVFSSIAIINFLTKWNSNLSLPDNWATIENLIKSIEENTQNLQAQMLSVSTIFGLIFNLIVMALVPAITEELFFRGGIQKILVDWMRNPHIAIIASGLIFSFAHLQFYGFVPRAFMGISLGYLFYFSKNIWVPIFAHFLNNGMIVIVFFIQKNYLNKEPKLDDFGGSIDNPILYVSILVLGATFFYFIKKKRKLSL